MNHSDPFSLDELPEMVRRTNVFTEFPVFDEEDETEGGEAAATHEPAAPTAAGDIPTPPVRKQPEPEMDWLQLQYTRPKWLENQDTVILLALILLGVFFLLVVVSLIHLTLGLLLTAVFLLTLAAIAGWYYLGTKRMQRSDGEMLTAYQRALYPGLGGVEQSSSQRITRDQLLRSWNSLPWRDTTGKLRKVSGKLYSTKLAEGDVPPTGREPYELLLFPDGGQYTFLLSRSQWGDIYQAGKGSVVYLGKPGGEHRNDVHIYYYQGNWYLSSSRLREAEVFNLISSTRARVFPSPGRQAILPA